MSTITDESDRFSKKERYEHLVKVKHFRLSQANVWMVFFILINGGLLAAYGSVGSKDCFEKTLIAVVGYAAAFLFLCVTNSFRNYIGNCTELIKKNDMFEDESHSNKDENKNKKNILDYISPLRGNYISVPKALSVMSLILTYAWGILVVSNFFENFGIYVLLISVIIVTLANMLFLCLAVCFLSRENPNQRTIS